MGVYASMDWVKRYMTDLESHRDSGSTYISEVLDVVAHPRYQMAQEVTVVYATVYRRVHVSTWQTSVMGRGYFTSYRLVWDPSDFIIDRQIQDNFYRHCNLGFQERRMQMGHDGWIVMNKVAQPQHGGLFLRFAWDPGIAILDNSVAGIEGRTSSCLHEFGSIVEQLVEGLSELFQNRDALLIGSSREDSYGSALPNHISSDASPLLGWFGTLVSFSVSIRFIQRSDRLWRHCLRTSNLGKGGL